MIRATLFTGAFGALAVLAGCATEEPTYRDLDRIGRDYQHQPRDADEATHQDTCGARRFHRLIGTRSDQIDRATLPPRARVIMPGQMVTMDFSAERLNIQVAPDGLVTTIRCF